MTMTIKQLLSFSWMSQASYLDFTGLTSLSSAIDVQAQLTNQQQNQINPDKIFSAGQATAFTTPTNGFGFINYTPNDAAGFSATVFKANGATNDYTIAVRGTEPTLAGAVSDLLNADVLGVTLALLDTNCLESVMTIFYGKDGNDVIAANDSAFSMMQRKAA